MTSLTATNLTAINKTTVNFSKLLTTNDANELLTALNNLMLNESYQPYLDNNDADTLDFNDLKLLADEYKVNKIIQ